jgi:hypothetical protein
MLSRIKYPLITFLLSFAVLFFFYHTVILSPNDYIFSASGDGIKNYYTYLFHAKYDTSFWEFGGMNYPYGENIVYTDAHPLLSWILQNLGLADYGVGILNLLMLLSFPIASVVLFKILQHYKVNLVWSILAAIAITFMAPQLFRMSGHYALSYIFAIPLMWYLLIKTYHSGRQLIWSGIIALYLLLFFFTHPYLGIIMAFLAIFFWIIRAITERKDKKKALYFFLLIGVQIALPFIIFQGLVTLNDTHVGRSNNPAGFFYYHSDWKSILVPHSGPMNYFIRLFEIKLSKWETWSYIGFSSIVFGIFSLVYVLKRRGQFAFKKLLGTELFSFMIAAYLILLFSFCFPLKYDFLRGIVELFGPLKQFRVLGRFSWIFFYVGVVFVIVILHRIKERNAKPQWISALFFVGIAFYFVEAYPAHSGLSKVISAQKNEFKKEHLTDDLIETITFVEKGNFDAILFLPFTHMSSEIIMMLGEEEANHDALLMSYHTNTPLLNSISSRMSVDEAIEFNNLFSPEFIHKSICEKIGYDKKIALVKNHNALNLQELKMIWSSEEIFGNETYKVYDFDLEKWNGSFYRDQIVEEASQAQPLRDGWKSTDSSTWFIHESFDSLGGEIFFDGTGAKSDVKHGIDIVYSFECEEEEETNYTASFWYYAGVDRPDVSAFVERKFNNGADATWENSFLISESYFIVDYWCYVELEFEVTPETELINIILSGNGSEQPYILDEFFLRKTTEKALFRTTQQGRNGEEYLIYNNYWIKK